MEKEGVINSFIGGMLVGAIGGLILWTVFLV